MSPANVATWRCKAGQCGRRSAPLRLLRRVAPNARPAATAPVLSCSAPAHVTTTPCMEQSRQGPMGFTAAAEAHIGDALCSLSKGAGSDRQTRKVHCLREGMQQEHRTEACMS